MSKRISAGRTGVYYSIVNRAGVKGTEKSYYVRYKVEGRVKEVHVGRQYRDAMTPSKAVRKRLNLIEGRDLPRREKQALEADERAVLEAELTRRKTLDDLWAMYIKDKAGIKSLRNDKNRYGNHIAPVFGDVEPQNIEPKAVRAFTNRLMKKLKPATVKNVLELMRRTVNWGVKNRICKGLDFTIEMPKVNNIKTESLTPKQVENLLKAIEADTHPIAGNLMLLALYTGMRRGELFRLRWTDIDFDQGFIHLRDPKGGVDERIPLNESARSILKSCIRYKSPYVFPGRGGRQRVDIAKSVRRIRNAAGLPKSFRPLHGQRHAYASILASSGKVDLYVLQKLLTHKSPAMTMRYAHLADEALHRAGKVLTEEISKSKEG